MCYFVCGTMSHAKLSLHWSIIHPGIKFQIFSYLLKIASDYFNHLLKVLIILLFIRTIFSVTSLRKLNSFICSFIFSSLNQYLSFLANSVDLDQPASEEAS